MWRSDLPPAILPVELEQELEQQMAKLVQKMPDIFPGQTLSHTQTLTPC